MKKHVNQKFLHLIGLKGSKSGPNWGPKQVQNGDCRRTVQYFYVIPLQKMLEMMRVICRKNFLHNPPFWALWWPLRSQIGPKLGPEQVQNALWRRTVQYFNVIPLQKMLEMIRVIWCKKNIYPNPTFRLLVDAQGPRSGQNLAQNWSKMELEGEPFNISIWFLCKKCWKWWRWYDETFFLHQPPFGAFSWARRNRIELKLGA